jgi:hypothetical protein
MPSTPRPQFLGKVIVHKLPFESAFLSKAFLECISEGSGLVQRPFCLHTIFSTGEKCRRPFGSSSLESKCYVYALVAIAAHPP